jgi:DNA-directed RNA polymerase subunit RPC12/RpoP
MLKEKCDHCGKPVKVHHRLLIDDQRACDYCSTDCLMSGLARADADALEQSIIND